MFFAQSLALDHDPILACLSGSNFLAGFNSASRNLLLSLDLERTNSRGFCFHESRRFWSKGCVHVERGYFLTHSWNCRVWENTPSHLLNDTNHWGLSRPSYENWGTLETIPEKKKGIQDAYVWKSIEQMTLPGQRPEGGVCLDLSTLYSQHSSQRDPVKM
jgi:hypothetical protein